MSPLDTAASQPPVTAESIAGWLVQAVAELTGRSPQEIDIHLTFNDSGLDSLQMIKLAGRLEGWLGRELPPSLGFDYPTIAAVAAYLAGSEPAREAV